ncbi:MAG: hypothetical protein JOZ19_03485 [Rubrobacter sp.]|nr:hypothetical protein [Rubrobacter sp.]
MIRWGGTDGVCSRKIPEGSQAMLGKVAGKGKEAALNTTARIMWETRTFFEDVEEAKKPIREGAHNLLGSARKVAGAALPRRSSQAEGNREYFRNIIKETTKRSSETRSGI